MSIETRDKFWIYVLLVVLVLVWFRYDRLKKENFYLKDELAGYQSALDEANQNIEDANSMIEDAQSSAWSSYEEMGDALDNLQVVDTVSSP